MPNHAPARVRRWQATLIITLFFLAVAGAAALGWWYARESPPHQGPIVVISVDGIPAAILPAYGGSGGDAAAIDALAADGVVFDRAYAHAPQILPTHASLFSGQLPFQHGVRDDAGFALKPEARTLAELLRNRGFTTGAAMSSFLLRRETGVAQGFSFFDAELAAEPGDAAVATERPGSATIDAAERWARTQDGQRYFLFLQVDRADADRAVTRVTQLLREKRLYDKATVVLVGDYGEVDPAAPLDDRALHIPLIIKQPGSDGAGRRVVAPVQQVDLLPTLLDLVRAPIPGGLQGRSLRAVLDDDGSLPVGTIYSESLAAYYRFGGTPLYAVTGERSRLVRGSTDEVEPVAAGGEGEQAQESELAAALDRLLGSRLIEPPAAIPSAEQERYARAGYLGGMEPAVVADASFDLATQGKTLAAHHQAARLIGQKNYAAGLGILQTIARDHPMLAMIHYQIAALLTRSGRYGEAVEPLKVAGELRPDAAEVPIALAGVLMRAGNLDEAQQQADAAVVAAEKGAPARIAAAHEVAARVALLRHDAEGATAHAAAVRAADPTLPVPQLVKGRLLFDEGQYEAAAAAFQEGVAVLREHGTSLADLHRLLGEALTHLQRYTEAEMEFREELRAFPTSIPTYSSLALLYRASNRDEEVTRTLDELIEAAPTPAGYSAAARLWTVLGDRSRAEAVRADAQVRFKGDPSLAVLGRDGRR